MDLVLAEFIGGAHDGETALVRPDPIEVRITRRMCDGRYRRSVYLDLGRRRLTFSGKLTLLEHTSDHDAPPPPLELEGDPGSF